MVAVFFITADHYDVKMPCHLILSKLADKCPSAVLAGWTIFCLFGGSWSYTMLVCVSS